MKIKIYIVTYNNDKDLTDTLRSLYASDITSHDYQVFIINNHSNFATDISNLKNIEVLHNVLRPDFSTGFLSRNWNQALILGFRNLNDPDCDLVILAQDDTYFYPHWVENLIDLHKKYSFITYGWGDNCMSWTPEGVKQIGLWDERFQFGGHTSEYFFRALALNASKSSINDYHHKRVLNEEKRQIADRPDIPIGHQAERKTNQSRALSMIKLKFPQAVRETNATLTSWSTPFKQDPPDKFFLKSYIMYPYFEKDILTLERQNYT